MKTPIPFVIDPEPKVWWPVRVSVPVDAGFAEFAFEAQLRVYSEEDYARLLPEVAPAADLRAVLAHNAALIPQFVTDWRGVTDLARQPMPISALPAALTGPYGKAFSVGFNRAIAELRYGVAPDGESASRGNFAPPLAAGSTAGVAAEEPTI
jgi:hypothetical protein